MNILICDNHPGEAGEIEKLLANSRYDIKTAVFYSAEDVLRHIRSGAAVDAVFLDIIMPEMNGITLAAQLRREGFAGEIVFLSSSNEFAAESYRVEAFTYILKPLGPEVVDRTLTRLEDFRRHSDTDGILVTSSKAARFIPFREISYAEVIKHKVYFRLRDGSEAVTSATFGHIVPQLLRDKRFIRCHRSYVVNMNAVTAVDGNEIFVHSGARIPISKSYAEAKKTYLRWVFGENKR
jgi:two-component system LytT family response regulator